VAPVGGHTEHGAVGACHADPQDRSGHSAGVFRAHDRAGRGHRDLHVVADRRWGQPPGRRSGTAGGGQGGNDHTGDGAAAAPARRAKGVSAVLQSGVPAGALVPLGLSALARDQLEGGERCSRGDWPVGHLAGDRLEHRAQPVLHLAQLNHRLPSPSSGSPGPGGPGTWLSLAGNRAAPIPRPASGLRSSATRGPGAGGAARPGTAPR